MPKKVSIKNYAPLLVRMYNVFLSLCYKTGIIDYRINEKKYLKYLSKEKLLHRGPNPVAKKALKNFIINVNKNNLNPATQMFVKNELKRTLINRKKIIDIINKNKLKNFKEFSTPVFVVGLPRTGTTALQKMFSLVEDCRVLKLWELHHPTASFEGKRAIKDAKKDTKRYSFLQNFSKPEQKYIHPVGFNYPDECFRLLFNSFTSIAISSALGLDDYEEWVLESDLLGTYKEYKEQLQILSLSSPDRQMVLKAPEHLWNLDVLLKTFPSACLIMTHREPVQAIVSYASMISMFRRTAYKKPNFKKLGSYVTTVFEKGMRKAVKVRSQLESQGRIFDVHCDNIKKSPQQTIHKVCDFLNIEIDNKNNQQIKKWVKSKKTDAPGRHQYNYEKFGVNKASVKKIFHFYDDEKFKYF